MRRTENNDEAGTELPAYSEVQANAPKTNLKKISLNHSWTALWVAVGYSVLLLVSWIITAVSTQKPMYLAGYDAQDFDDFRLPFRVERQWNRSKRTFDAAQIIGTIAYTMTIPVISTVFGALIATRLQRDNRRRYTLRQLSMLADKNWNSPLKMLAACVRPEQTFSRYLWVGVLLTLLGTSLLSLSWYIPN
jgi:ABC-type phosphate/phosphonate transport system permease subunit